MKAGFKLCSGRLLWQGARKVAQFEDSAGLVFSKRDLLGWGWEERKDRVVKRTNKQTKELRRGDSPVHKDCSCSGAPKSSVLRAKEGWAGPPVSYCALHLDLTEFPDGAIKNIENPMIQRRQSVLFICLFIIQNMSLLWHFIVFEAQKRKNKWPEQ